MYDRLRAVWRQRSAAPVKLPQFSVRRTGIVERHECKQHMACLSESSLRFQLMKLLGQASPFGKLRHRRRRIWIELVEPGSINEGVACLHAVSARADPNTQARQLAVDAVQQQQPPEQTSEGEYTRHRGTTQTHESSSNENCRPPSLSGSKVPLTARSSRPSAQAQSCGRHKSLLKPSHDAAHVVASHGHHSCSW